MPLDTRTAAFPLPRLTGSQLVVAPPEDRPGAWAGGPCALAHDGTVYLAYRLRRPVGEGRGYRNVVAASRDGVHFETVDAVERDQFGAESLERPALAVTPDGRWRLYVSCATPGTKHWRVDLLEADSPDRLSAATPRTVLAGDALHAVKDPVVRLLGDRWHLWASVHPLGDPDHTDRMTTEYATSPDGVDWQWHATALSPRPGQWDARGVRVSSVLTSGSRILASYDGRATAAQNWEERTGLAVGELADGTAGPLVAADSPPLGSPHAGGGLRYLSVLATGDEPVRLYYELTRPDGAHELRTEVVTAPP